MGSIFCALHNCKEILENQSFAEISIMHVVDLPALKPRMEARITCLANLRRKNVQPRTLIFNHTKRKTSHYPPSFIPKIMTTTMHFGPEWMRTKHQVVTRPQPAPSPPPANSHAPPNASTYSALVSPAPAPEPEKRDETHPFRYSKEEMLRIYKEGGGKGGLGLEVERWEGVVREVGSDPIGIREMGDGEKKVSSILKIS